MLSAHGLGPESKVGIYLHNSSEYLEAQFAAFKIRGCPINVNYRYKADELVYLLDNWDAETTTCRENGGECKRDAEPVRRALGLRSTTDPLFQIEKVFNKVKYMDIDPDKLDAFFEASEDWNSAMNMSNSMAFISQFGVSFGIRAG